MSLGGGSLPSSITSVELFEENAEWAKCVARGWAKRHRVPTRLWEQCEQGALIGLWSASQRFDESRGLPFRKYAERRVTGGVVDELRDESKWRNAMHKHSINTDFTEVEMAAPPDRQADIKEEVEHRLKAWSPRARALARLYLAGWTLKQVGKTINVSESRICQMFKREARNGKHH